MLEIDATLKSNHDLIRHDLEVYKTELEKNRPKKRLLQLLSKGILNPKNSNKSLHFNFLHSPKEILRDEKGVVSGLLFEKNRIESGKVIGTGEFQEYKAGLVIKSIGYESEPIEGIPWDHERNIVPNQLGFVKVHVEKWKYILLMKIGRIICVWMVKKGACWYYSYKFI